MHPVSMAQIPSPEFLEFQHVVAGRYSLQRELGRGGMGIVYLARDVALDRPVAIKLLPAQLAADDLLRERFLREARTAAKLSHPNIVPIFSVEHVQQFVFFVMAYVDGETLTDRLSQRGPLPTRDAIRVLRELAWALVHAHAQGVVHRDIKPDNILLENGTGRALVTDFGIAQITGVETGTGVTEIIGTPAFMSPEQAVGVSVDARSDIYSLGVVGFLALSGRMPFTGAETEELLAQHIASEPPRLIAAAPGVPRSLAHVVERCLAKDPDQRIQTAHQLAEALGVALDKRRELPVAVRFFVQETKRKQQRGYWLIYLLLGVWVGGPLVFAPVPLLQMGGFALIGTLLGVPLASLIHRVRRVVRAGYGQDDIVRAFTDDLTSRDEELKFLYGPNYRATGRKLRRFAYLMIGLAGLNLIGLFAAPSTIVVLTTVGLAAGAVVASVLADQRSDRRPRRRIKFWRGRLARWLFRVAGIGVEPARTLPTLTEQPTEIAVGMAVSSLFDALPKAVRQEMADLPDVVRGLENDAQRMRTKLEEFNELLAHVGDAEQDPRQARDDSIAGQRFRAAHRLRAARDEAEHRLRETVAALEQLRVDLLRLQAGTTELTSVTTNLGAARDLAAHVDRLLESYEEVEGLLDEPMRE